MGVHGFNKYTICPVVLGGATDVPPISEVFTPGVSVTGFDMELYGASPMGASGIIS